MAFGTDKKNIKKKRRDNCINPRGTLLKPDFLWHFRWKMLSENKASERASQPPPHLLFIKVQSFSKWHHQGSFGWEQLSWFAKHGCALQWTLTKPCFASKNENKTKKRENQLQQFCQVIITTYPSLKKLCACNVSVCVLVCTIHLLIHQVIETQKLYE